MFNEERNSWFERAKVVRMRLKYIHFLKAKISMIRKYATVFISKYEKLKYKQA
jgi:hypothetical protein